MSLCFSFLFMSDHSLLSPDLGALIPFLFLLIALCNFVINSLDFQSKVTIIRTLYVFFEK